MLLDNYIEASAQIAIRDQLQTAQDELKAGGGGGGGGGQQVPVVAFKTNITHSVAHRLARHILQGRRGGSDARLFRWRLGYFSAFDSPLCWGGPQPCSLWPAAATGCARSGRPGLISSPQARSPLDPLLMQLARDFTDDQDLSDRLQKLYKVVAPCSLAYLSPHSSSSAGHGRG